MTNNQRFFAELVVLLTIGAAIICRANPKRQEQVKLASVQDVVSARRFVLVDQNDKPRCTLQVNQKENATELIITGQDGVERVRLGDKGNRTLVLSDPQGSLTTLAEGKLEMTRKDGKEAAALTRGYLNITFQKPADFHPSASDEYKLWYIAEFLDSRTESGIDLVEDINNRPRVEVFQKKKKPRFFMP